jgi:hypothetical protein
MSEDDPNGAPDHDRPLGDIERMSLDSLKRELSSSRR